MFPLLVFDGSIKVLHSSQANGEHVHWATEMSLHASDHQLDKCSQKFKLGQTQGQVQLQRSDVLLNQVLLRMF